MDLNGFYSYDVQILITKNNESGEPSLNNVEEKSQDKKELTIHNNIINIGWNQINYMIQVSYPLFQDSQTMALGLISTLPLSCKK